jgi:hypothetical protein
MSKQKSNGPTKLFSYRITENDRKSIEEFYGISLTEFFNAMIKKELKSIEKKKLTPVKKSA